MCYRVAEDPLNRPFAATGTDRTGGTIAARQAWAPLETVCQARWEQCGTALCEIHSGPHKLPRRNIVSCTPSSASRKVSSLPALARVQSGQHRASPPHLAPGQTPAGIYRCTHVLVRESPGRRHPRVQLLLSQVPRSRRNQPEHLRATRHGADRSIGLRYVDTPAGDQPHA